MKDVLRELYNGEIYPAEQIEIETAEYRAAVAYSDARQAFKEKLPRELVNDFEKLKDYEERWYEICQKAAKRLVY